MFLRRRIDVKVLLQFAWRMQLFAFGISALCFALYKWAGIHSVAVPFLPVATIGTAVAFYVGFKNNSAYDRLWEARRIWGGITNVSRMWATTVHDVLGARYPNDAHEIEAVKKDLLYRHLAWVNMLRLQLRRLPVFNEAYYVNSPQLNIIRRIHGEHNYEKNAEEVLHKFTTVADRKVLEHSVNPAATLLQLQNATLIDCKKRGWLDEYEHSDAGRLILECYNQQGAAERIKTFPFPRQYAAFSVVFVFIFVFLLPFGMISDLDRMGPAWLVIPFTMLLAWVFTVMEQVGDASENPFDNGINDVPMTAICRNIEIEFRQLRGEENLPPRLQPVEGILM